MKVDARETDFEKFELFDQTVLFTCARIDRDTVPDGIYAYDLRDDCEGNIGEVAPYVFVNHWGTVLCRKPIEKGDNEWYYRLVTDDDYNYLGDEITLAEWLEEGE